MAMYNRDSYQKFMKEKFERKAYSVVCKCGHRVFINSRKEFAICYFCGRKHTSPKENFKNKLNSLLRENG